MTTQHDYRSLRAIGTEHSYRSGLTIGARPPPLAYAAGVKSCRRALEPKPKMRPSSLRSSEWFAPQQTWEESNFRSLAYDLPYSPP